MEIENIFKHKYFKYKGKNEKLENQIGGIVRQKCEGEDDFSNNISLFDLNKLGSLADKIVEDHDYYIDNTLKYSSKHKCFDNRNENKTREVKKLVDIRINHLRNDEGKTEDEIKSLKHNIYKTEEQKYNSSTGLICKYAEKYNANKNGHLINIFFDKSYSRTIDVVNLQTHLNNNIKEFKNTYESNILLDVIGSFLNISCDNQKINNLINKIETQDKKLYIIDFMNVCNAISQKKLPEENTNKIILDFIKSKIENDDYIIIIHKNGCMDKKLIMDFLENATNATILNKLNINLHFITMSSKGNIDDFVFWIFGIYFLTDSNI